MLDASATVDRTRPFICDTLTPLYYTPTWAELETHERLTYNQLNGMYWNELIAAFEKEMALAVLNAAGRRGGVPASIRERLRGFANDEIEHARAFARLNQLSDPRRYANGERSLLRLPPGAGLLVPLLAASSAVSALVWLMLLIEERSIAVTEIAACNPDLDPAYASVYAAHAEDERRHVAVDVELLALLHERRGATVRSLTATVFRSLVQGFLIGPGPAAMRIVDALIDSHPRLAPLRPRLRRELRALASDRGYHRMMYSREKVPITFALFDRLPEMHRMQSVLLGYEATA